MREVTILELNGISYILSISLDSCGCVLARISDEAFDMPSSICLVQRWSDIFDLVEKHIGFELGSRTRLRITNNLLFKKFQVGKWAPISVFSPNQINLVSYSPMFGHDLA